MVGGFNRDTPSGIIVQECRALAQQAGLVPSAAFCGHDASSRGFMEFGSPEMVQQFISRTRGRHATIAGKRWTGIERSPMELRAGWIVKLATNEVAAQKGSTAEEAR